MYHEEQSPVPLASMRFSHFSYSSHMFLQLTWHLVRRRPRVRLRVRVRLGPRHRIRVRLRVGARVLAVDVALLVDDGSRVDLKVVGVGVG